MVTLRQRKHMADLMWYLIEKEPQIHYKQVRPMQTAKLTEARLREILDGGGNITMDCSEAVTMICRLAGLPDPNGLLYNGLGYTGTMLDHMVHFHDASKAGRGSILIIGAHTGDHACQVLVPGTNPLLYSHGMERGPIAIRFLDELAYHKGKPYTFLNIGRL